MAVLLRTVPLVSASVLLCAQLLCAQGEMQAGADGVEGDCEARSEGEDIVSYLQRFASEAQLDASTDEASAAVAAGGGASPAATAAGEGGSTATFFRKGDESDLPRPGADYPEQLRGVIWLDQAGVYGFSDTGAAAPDLLVSFHNSLNQTARTMTLNPGGPAWTWQNNKEAYKTFGSLMLADFLYDFEWNEDYTEARIYPAFHLFGYKLNVWSFLVDFRMVLQKPAAEGECPPKVGASKKEVSKCALWLRKSWVLAYPVWNTYPVFRVLDEAGAPIAPYYDEYVKFAKKTASPDVKRAKLHLGEGVQGAEDGLWFAGAGTEGSQNLGDVQYSQIRRAMRTLRMSMPSFGLI